MSFFLGGRGNKAKPQFTGLSTQTSTSNLPIPICWGKNRVAPNIIWQGDFQSHKQKQKAGKGGPKIETYTYSASFQLGLCWGQINDITKVWKDQSKETDYTKLGFTLFKGTTPQSPWGYMTTNHPTQALGYPGIVHLDAANYDLGGTNNLPQHSFEVEGLRWHTGVGGTVDGADPALIIQDFLTDPSFGVGVFNFAIINADSFYSGPNATTTGDNAFQTYCRAMGFHLSPSLISQDAAGSTVQRWASLCNTAIVWTGYSLKFYPYGTDETTANGVHYLPSFPVRYSLTDKDFVAADNQDPITFSRVDPADATNLFSIVIANKDNEYNDLPIPWKDQGLIDQFGARKRDTMDAKEITDPVMGSIVAVLMGQREAYIRNTFKFDLPISFFLLEPMDIVRCTDPVLGIFDVLIRDTMENDDGSLSITAEEFHGSVTNAAASSNTPMSVSNTPVNTSVAAGPVNPPIILEPPTELAGAVPQIWAAVSGGDGTTNDPNWGGAYVWLSTDNVTYNRVGTAQQARMGKLSAILPTYGGANPDTANTLAVDITMSAGEISDAASAADAAAGVTVSYVGGELISYENVTLTAPYEYDLTSLYRKQYGSTVGAHAIGDPFARLDDNVFKYDLPPEYIGQTIYIKFQSFNIFGGAVEDLSLCTAYTYVPTGAGFGTGTSGVPSAPTGLTATSAPGGAKLIWDQSPINDNPTQYKVYRAAGLGALFGTAVVIATVAGTANIYNDISLDSNTPYTYFLVAVNLVGDSLPTAGVDFTSGNTAILSPIYVPSVYLAQAMNVYTAPVRMIYHKISEPCKARVNLDGWQCGASANATGSTVLTVERALAAAPNTFTTVGTITIAAGTITPTFATTGALAYDFAIGDVMRVSGPATNDATLADLHVTALLDRTG